MNFKQNICVEEHSVIFKWFGRFPPIRQLSKRILLEKLAMEEKHICFGLFKNDELP